MNKILNSPIFKNYLFLVHFILWGCLSLVLDLHPDMSDHWVWSRFLDFGYYEHPPMVAWTMRIADLLIPDPVIAMKLGSLIFSVIILQLAHKTAKTYFDLKTANLFILLLELTPYFSVASLFWHIDQAYMVFWLINLICIGKFIQTKNLNWILLFGVSAGFGALSKYITLLFYFGLFFWCIYDKNYRYLLFKWQTYAAGLISLTIFSPVLYWNYKHDWISFKFQFGRGFTGGQKYFGKHFIEFTIGHILLFSPIFSIHFWTLFSKRKIAINPNTSILIVVGLVPFLFFTGASFQSSLSDSHWLNVSYFSFLMLLSSYLLKTNFFKKKKTISLYLGAGAVFNLFLISMVLYQVFIGFLPIHYKNDPTKKLIGWSDSAQKIDSLLKRNQKKAKVDYVISREYQLSGALAMYMESHPLSHSIEKPERNTWSLVENVRKANSIFVCVPESCKGALNKATARFKKPFVFLGEIQTKVLGNVVRELKVYSLKN